MTNAQEGPTGPEPGKEPGATPHEPTTPKDTHAPKATPLPPMDQVGTWALLALVVLLSLTLLYQGCSTAGRIARLPDTFNVNPPSPGAEGVAGAEVDFRTVALMLREREQKQHCLISSQLIASGTLLLVLGCVLIALATTQAPRGDARLLAAYCAPGTLVVLIGALLAIYSLPGGNVETATQTLERLQQAAEWIPPKYPEGETRTEKPKVAPDGGG